MTDLVRALVAMLGFASGQTPARYAALAELAAPLVEEAVRLEGGDSLVLGAVLVKESSLRPHVFGKHGEVGLGQIKPDGLAAIECRDLDIHQSADNVRCAARLLARAKATCGEAAVKVYLSLYSGRRRCRASGYSMRIMAILERARVALAVGPPAIEGGVGIFGERVAAAP